jgi:hypothetical protein
MVPFSHPKPSGQGAHTRSELGTHSRTATVPEGHAPEHGKHTLDDGGDHASAHGSRDVVLHMNPASHGQQTPGWVSVQL